MECYKCQKELSTSFSFSCLCEHCFSYQHCCLNCKHYTPGKHNDCNIPEAELCVDKESGNRCEYMQVKGSEAIGEEKTKDAQAKSDFFALFGEEAPEDDNSKSAKERFDDLFNS
ncbi:MAG: hypothetical protein L7U87_05125 [Chlamydiales bacterium]|nr:hypothetical protein [Chlamydiales bacterium]